MENGSSILQLDLQSFLTLELKDTMWTKDKTVLLDQRNIYQVIKAFEKIIDSIYNGGLFAVTKSNKTIMYKEDIDKHTQRIYNIGTHQRMIVHPALIYDEAEDTEYEGVMLYLNKSENFVELPIDAFEALYYTLKQVNMFVYSQLLVNYYMSSIQNDKVEIKQNVMTSNKLTVRKPHPLEKANTEVTKSTVTPKQSAEEFFNFPKKE